MLFRNGQTEPGVYYNVYLLKDAAACRGPVLVGTGSSLNNPEKVLVRPDQQVGFSIVFVKPNRSYCVVRPAFTPKLGQRYLMTVRTQPGFCSVGVANASNPDNIVRESTATFKDGRCNAVSNYTQTEDSQSADAGATANSPKLFNKPFDDDLKDLIKKEK